MSRLMAVLLIVGMLGVGNVPAAAAPAPLPDGVRPFILPFAGPPGPSNWMLGQAYGNTTGAYRQRARDYRAGQGVHFGVDVMAACGTPVVAIGDGTVALVDAASHGSPPHNLIISHPNGYASFYGHLLETPKLVAGQEVKAGQVVARSGDPDQTCTSRPHLHLEIRNAGGLNRAYNPMTLIDADWDTLALANGAGFERDLSAPRRWQSLLDQPETAFWGPVLNDYANPWPLDWTR
jgi:murein DD-endopeptidase MepM/ murein hydrolase activator NlpD